MLDPRPRPPTEPLPEHDRAAREREREGHEEVEEPGRERLVGADVETAEEADEERLADGESVQRERHEHDEEEERPHHVVDADVEVDADRLRGGPDREDPHGLHGERDREHGAEEAWRSAVVVDALVEAADDALHPQPPEERLRTAEQRARGAGEEEEPEDDRPEHEDALEPEVGAHVEVADREDEADRAEEHRRRPAEPALEHDGPRDRGRTAGMSAGSLENAYRIP